MQVRSIISTSRWLPFRRTGFCRCERGAISSDWLALGAGILLLGLMLNYALTHNGMEPTEITLTKSPADAGRIYESGYKMPSSDEKVPSSGEKAPQSSDDAYH